MAWELYFEERITRKVKGSLVLKKRVKKLWQMQKGKCPKCQGEMTKETGWNEHRIIPGLLGGKYILSNLQLLHPKCHRQLHSQDRKCVAASS
jgi:RNA-directed DNA polymerase